MRDLLEKLDQITEFKSFDIQTPHQRERNFQKIKYEVGQLPFPRPDIAKTKQVFNDLLNTDLHGSPSDDWIEATFYGLLGKKFKFPKMYTPSGKVIDSAGQSGIDNFEETEADEESAVRQNNSGLFPKEVYDSNSQYKKWFEYNTKNIAAVPPGVIDVTNDDPGEDKDKQAGVQSFGNDDEEWAKPLSKGERMRAGLTDYSGDNDAQAGVGPGNRGDNSGFSGGKVTVTWNGEKVEIPTANNYNDWIKRGQEILDKYRDMLDKDGHLPSSLKTTESIQSVKSLFYLLESSFREKRLLQQSWKEYTRIMLKALKNLPKEARDAFKGQTDQKTKLDTAAKAYADIKDPALGGPSSFTSNTTSSGKFTGNADEVEQQGDKYLEKIHTIILQLDQNDLINSIKKGAKELEDFALRTRLSTGARLSTEKIRDYKAKFYSLVAKELGLQGFLKTHGIYFADGSIETVDPNNKTHKEIALAQHKLGALDSRDASYYADMFNLKDLPKQSGMSQQMGTKDIGRKEVKWNGKSVIALNKYNWKDWIARGNELLKRAQQTESIKQISQMLKLTEANYGFKNKQDRDDYEVLKTQFRKNWKEIPSEARNAYNTVRGEISRVLRAYADDDDPALGGPSSFTSNKNPGTFTLTPDQETAAEAEYGVFGDAMTTILNNTTVQTLKQALSKLPELDNYNDETITNQFYGLLAKYLRLDGLIQLDKSGGILGFGQKYRVTKSTGPKKDMQNQNPDVFPYGVEYKTVEYDKHSNDIKNIAQKQFNRGLLTPELMKELEIDPSTLAKASSITGMGGGSFGKLNAEKFVGIKKLITRYKELVKKANISESINDTYRSSSLYSFYKLLHESLTDDEVFELNKIYNQLNRILNNPKQKDQMNNQLITDISDVVTNHAGVMKNINTQISQQKGRVKATQNADELQSKKPDSTNYGSQGDYGIFSDLVNAVANRPTVDNLIKQAEAAAAMNLKGFDTDHMKFRAFYGHLAKALGLQGLITHRNTAVDSPMVVFSRARDTEHSDSMPEMLPFGEYYTDSLEFDNPTHKTIAQAQLNKNLLPASIQWSRSKKIDDVYKRFGITKQETPSGTKSKDELNKMYGVTEPPAEETPPVGGDDKRQSTASQSVQQPGSNNLSNASIKQVMHPWTGKDAWVIMVGKKRATQEYFSSKEEAQKYLDRWGKKSSSPAAVNVSTNSEQPPNKEKMPTGKYAYDRYVPLPRSLNRLFRGKREVQYYVDRIPLPGRGLMSNQLQITSDTKGTGFETVHDTKFNRARDAIMKFLKDNNTSLIDQAEWANLKKWNDMAGDGPGDGWLVNHDRDVRNKDVEVGKNKYGPPSRTDDQPQAAGEPDAPEQLATANQATPTGDSRPINYGLSSPTGITFSVAQDKNGWYVTQTLNGKTKPDAMNKHYSTKEEAEKAAEGRAKSTNSKYQPYKGPDNPTPVTEPVPATTTQDTTRIKQVQAATEKAIAEMRKAGKDNVQGRQVIFNKFEMDGWLDDLELYANDNPRMKNLHAIFTGVKDGDPRYWMTDAQMQQRLDQQNNNTTGNKVEQASPEVTEKINAWRQAARARGGTGKLIMANYENGTVAVIGEGVPTQNGLPVPLSAKMSKKLFLEQFGKYLNNLNKDLFIQPRENKDFTRLLKNAGLLKEFY